jgi:hypothetical protein
MPPPDAPLYFPVPPVILYGYSLRCEPSSQNQDPEMFYSYLEIFPIYGQLGRKQEALDAWRGLLKEYPGASAETFADWWRLWNIHEDEVAKLMEGVYKSGVLGVDAKAGQRPGAG